MRSFCSACVLLAAFAAIPCISQASLQVGSKIRLDTSLPGDYGGRFGVTDGGSPAGKNVSPFETFCVEITETITHNGVYTIVGISDTTVLGGRTLTSYAAWLYTQFRNGTLNGFDYSTTIATQTTNDANALQYILWREMNYSNANINSALPGSPAAGYQALYNAKSWAADYAADNAWDKSGIGNVRVINIVDASGNHRQDQLVLVPEATTIVVWSALSFIGLAAYRRRSKPA